MNRISVLLIFACIALRAQQARAPPQPAAQPAAQPVPPPAPQPARPPGADGSVSGRVLDADTGAPLQEVGVVAQEAGLGESAQTDAQGRYTITGVSPGPHTIAVYGLRRWPNLGSATAVVAQGQPTVNIDFRVRFEGEISGRVIDAGNDPVVGMPVMLIGREYYAGALRYFNDGGAITNDRGEYVLPAVRAGRTVFVLAEIRKLYKAAISDAPAKPGLRIPAYRATYYPSAESVQSATAIRLRSSEHRENVDIRILRSPSYCVDAVLMANGAPASLNFKVTDELTSSAYMTPGSASSGPPGVISGPDGRIRICELYPGTFRIAAFQRSGGTPDLFGATTVAIGNGDVHDVEVAAVPPAPVQADVAWEGAAPDAAVPVQFQFSAQPVSNDAMPGRGPHAGVPGQFSFTGLQSLEYAVRMFLGPAAAVPNAYIKDVAYGSQSVFHQPFKIGAAGPGVHLRITAGNDGGFIKAAAPPGSRILIMPAAAASEAIVADSLVGGQTSPAGAYTSPALAPGRYYVLATADLLDNTPESIAAVWRARTAARLVELAANGTAQVSLEVKSIN
jgi:hypothetical protein